MGGTLRGVGAVESGVAAMFRVRKKTTPRVTRRRGRNKNTEGSREGQHQCLHGGSLQQGRDNTATCSAGYGCDVPRTTVPGKTGVRLRWPLAKCNNDHRRP